MRFHTSGTVRRLDLSRASDLLDAMRGEWAALTFTSDGVVNPLTRRPDGRLRLVEGRHRDAGARYEVEPATDDAAGDVAELEHFVVTLRRDDATQLAFSVSDAGSIWTAEIDVTHDRLPSVVIDAHADLTAAWRRGGVPGCMAGLFGGEGHVRMVVGTRTLDRGGELLTVAGRANRFTATGEVGVRPSNERWDVQGEGALRGRGFGRLVLAVFRGRIRSHVEASIGRAWDAVDAAAADLERALDAIGGGMAAEGGAGPYVHRLLWDEHFDPHLPGAGG